MVATVLAASPSTVKTADAGPAAASSDGVEPVMAGKVAGSVSQIRPQSVSVWLVAEPPPLDAADAPEDGAAETGTGVDTLGATEAPLAVHAASPNMPSSATATATPGRFIRRRLSGSSRNALACPGRRRRPTARHPTRDVGPAVSRAARRSRDAADARPRGARDEWPDAG